jgi:hypothetical protein
MAGRLLVGSTDVDGKIFKEAQTRNWKEAGLAISSEVS